MENIRCSVAVIGGGPAGMAAAAAAKEEGADCVVVIERDTAPGGILKQCIHPGFGLSYFNEELTGPEYAGRFEERAREMAVEFLSDTTVLEVKPDGTLLCSSSDRGMVTVKADSVILAMGCRERTRGSLQIPGTRPAGIYTAGTAQRLINRQNQMVGKEVVILGSGDIGMIMARRLTLEGATVRAVVEQMDYLAGLLRNRVQCLEDFGIPLLLSHTVTRIAGRRRVEGVFIAQVDEDRRAVRETEYFLPCDTLLLSVGLIPENELTRMAGVLMDPVTRGPVVNQYMQTSIPCLFACGNVLHVNDLADHVSRESEQAGRYAARYAMGNFPKAQRQISCVPGKHVRYLCPQRLAVSGQEKVVLYFRTGKPEENVRISVESDGKRVAEGRRERVNPGEMERLELELGSISGDCLTVRVEKA